jgi:hypothetical protein
VARDDHVHVHRHDALDGLQPSGDVAVVSEWRDVEEADIAREQNLVLREIMMSPQVWAGALVINYTTVFP